MTAAAAPDAPRAHRPALPWRVLALLGLAVATLVGCGDDDPPADTGGDGAGLGTEDGSTETSVSGNEPDGGADDEMNDDPESDDDAVTDGSGESGQGGQTGAAGGDSG